MITKEQFEQTLALAAYKEYGECSRDELKILAKEKELCSKSFARFCKYIKILQPPTIANEGGLVQFQLWEHVRIFLKALFHERLIVLLKSRQIGASWSIAAFCLWKALFNRGDTSLLFSKGKIEAAELLEKCRRMYISLPPFLKCKVDPNSTTEMGFPSMQSSIKAFAATETAGISFTASRIVADEWIEHPYAEANYLASKPCIDAGGQFIGIFTINKTKLSSLPVGIYKDAVLGKNGFLPLFFPWAVREGRDSDWYKRTMDSIPEVELGTLTPEVYMASNYPTTVEEALSPEQTISPFSIESLNWMMGQVRNPQPVSTLSSGHIHVFKPHYLGNYYIAVTDTSHGVGKDYSVTVVLDVKTGEVVADVMSNRVSEEELAKLSIDLLEYYGYPLWAIEDNDWGRSTILAAQRMHYPRLYHDQKRNQVGYRTLSGDSGRVAAWGSLIPAVNNRQLIVYNKVGLLQFYDLIKNAEKGGRIEAMANRHDDYPMALSIAWFLKDKVIAGNTAPKPILTATFE